MGKWRAICFDLDGVLIDSMPLHAEAWQHAGKKLGLAIHKRFIYEHEGEPGSMTARLLFGAKKNRAGKFRKLLLAKEDYFRKQAKRIRMHKELVASLRWLNARGIPLALVTGTSWSEVHRVVSKPILRQFKAIITGDRVKRGKPNPDPYLAAFKALRVKPRQAVVVENAPYGIESARRAKAGYVVAFSSSLPKRFLRDADWVGPTSKSVAGYLKDLAGNSLQQKNKRGKSCAVAC